MSNPPVPVQNAQPVAVPGRVGQATAVEQSRAVAEVQAAVIVAQQCPRNVGAARTEMRESCAQIGLAERAFYKYNRGGGTVSGPSVHLARELARCWGNVQYGIAELRRDDAHGESEMQAWAWDVQTNSRSSQTFIVPHMRDKKGGPERLTDLRDIYENNANMGARRLREAIFSILPPWFTEEAKELCTQTLQPKDGKSLEESIEAAVAAFVAIDVTKEQLERKLGRKSERWTPFDIAQLRITHKSIARGEIAVDEEFPPVRVSAEDLAPAPNGTTATPVKKAAARKATPKAAATEELTPEPTTDAPAGELQYAPDDPGRPFDEDGD